MLKTGTILAELYSSIKPKASKRKVIDLRIGLGYIGVVLDNGSMGIAAVLLSSISLGCTLLPAAGSFAGSSAADLIKYLVNSNNSLEVAIGLATANALIEQPSPDTIDDREATSYLDLQKGKKVAMVGLFAPLVDRIKTTGAELTIIERNPVRLELLNDKAKNDALKSCHVAIITATTLINSTFEETINILGEPLTVIVMGPSTPLLPAIFEQTPVTHLGGTFITNPARVMQIISEGGGTPALRSYSRFVNLIRK